MNKTDTQKVLDALKLAVRQNGHDMLMTGEELRKCDAAIALCEASLARVVEPVVQVQPKIAELLERIDDAWHMYERVGPTCYIESHPMTHASTTDDGKYPGGHAKR